ncbi:MAG TPA: hypothetical protein VFY05_13345, partial [Candidatus Angelobacter sp.]|nr:hypothetical protein [Candidatus Angelobacter sp.]
MILIISRSCDWETGVIVSALQERQIAYMRVDTDQFLDSGRMYLRTSADNTAGELAIQDKCADINAIHTVWYRRQSLSRLAREAKDENRFFAIREYQHFMRSIWNLLADSFWINPLHATESAEIKPYQLEQARKVGLRVPKTLITNDPDAALTFFEECDGKIVYKPLAQYARLGEDRVWQGIYTTPVSQKDLFSRREQIRIAPCCFQEYIAKQVELRCTVIGSQILSIEIDSQKSATGKHDWRRHSDDVSYRLTELPPDITMLVHALLSKLEL